MMRKGIADPEFRKVVLDMAMAIFALRSPGMTPEQLLDKKPELEEAAEFIYQKFVECHHESVDGILEIMDQMGSFPALRARLVKYRDEI